MQCRDWQAWYDKMPGVNDPRLHVAGRCGLESSSIKLTLVPGNEGTVDDPELFVLELVMDKPDNGDKQYVEVDVSWSGDAGPDIKRVRIQGAVHVDDIAVIDTP